MTEIFALRLVFYIIVLVLGAWGAVAITRTFASKDSFMGVVVGAWWGVVVALMLGDWLRDG